MQIFNPGQKFTMNYATYDQNESLYVAFSIYNITTGTAVFEAKVHATLIAFGTYTAQYDGLSNQAYLVIGAVYTSNTYTVVDTNRSPSCDTYQAKVTLLTLISFCYGAYDQSNALFPRANIYNVTSGTPALVTSVNLTDVALGVYFGVYTGLIDNNYEVDIGVYTDGTYTTVDLNRSPSCQSVSCIVLAGIVVLDNAILEAQSLDAILEGNCA